MLEKHIVKESSNEYDQSSKYESYLILRLVICDEIRTFNLCYLVLVVGLVIVGIKMCSF
jgi:hypothetical protein